jgi:hypothetical protein
MVVGVALIGVIGAGSIAAIVGAIIGAIITEPPYIVEASEFDHDCIRALATILAGLDEFSLALCRATGGGNQELKGRAHDGPGGIIFTAETYALSLPKMFSSKPRPGAISAASVLFAKLYCTNPRAWPPETLQEQPVPSQPGSRSKHVFTEVAQ